MALWNWLARAAPFPAARSPAASCCSARTSSTPATGATNWVVVVIAIATLALEVWMLIEAFMLWPRVKGVLEAPLPPLAKPAN